MAYLLVEAGNTALKAAWAEGTTLGKTFRYQGEKMMDYLLSLLDRERPEVLTVASAYGVSPEEEALLRARCGHLLILDRAHTGLLLRQDLPEYLSFDRAAALVAAGVGTLAGVGLEVVEPLQVLGAVVGTHVEAFDGVPHQLLVVVGTLEVFVDYFFPLFGRNGREFGE